MPQPSSPPTFVRLAATALLLGAVGLVQAGPVKATAGTKNTAQLKLSAYLGDANNARPVHADLIDRLRQGMTLPSSSNPYVAVHERWFAARPDHLNRVIERSQPYLHHIVEAVEARGMPAEIALLPIIESGFNPRAESPMRASGLWQFIPATGRLYGLTQNGWYDGRRDVLQATRAALDYLESLHGMFGDWQLALAAYNCGEGCVQRAINKNRARGLGTDFDHLALPRETRHYVPKLIAVRNIVLDPARYGIELGKVPDRPYFMQVKLNQPIAARTAADLAEMEFNEFLALNPAYRRKVIYTDTPGMLLLPVDRIETFHFNLHQQGRDKVKLRTYRAKRGESLQAIAKRFGVSLSWLREHNPVKLRSGKLAAATEIVLPSSAAAPGLAASEETTSDKPAAAQKPARKIKTAAKRVHTVRRGDTLSGVAKRYGVRLADLRALNPGDRLSPGDRLHIPENG